MQFKKEIEQSLERIQTLEELFRHARNSEILPISFFSTSYDIVRELAGVLHHIEQEQLKFMQEQFIASKISFLETTDFLSKTKPVENLPEIDNDEEEISEELMRDSFFPEPVPEISEEENEKKPEQEQKQEHIPEEIKILADTRKYMSLNDKFRFQREIFMGSAEEMNKVFDALNEFSTIENTQVFVESQSWHNDSEIVVEFKELIEKRFS
ncbi:MAG: hypothetical protein LBI82_11090 [Dysgonamonadaceae bacterium]|jgi:hypothetical protein|nr:hypothetical protein [Dysgonamonadaceae bacterium]